METEFEAKFYPVEKKEVRKRLKRIGATLEIPERKMKRYIADCKANDLLDRKNYIRVRDEGNLVRLSFKETAQEGGDLADQKELDVEVSDMEKTVEILKLSGIKFNRYQETLREEWEYEGALITIDTWPGLKPYVEIEAASEGEVKKIAEKMDFEWDKKIITAAAEVYSKVYGMDINKVLDKISDLTFENNPFSGMSMKWEGEKKD